MVIPFWQKVRHAIDVMARVEVIMADARVNMHSGPTIGVVVDDGLPFVFGVTFVHNSKAHVQFDCTMSHSFYDFCNADRAEKVLVTIALSVGVENCSLHVTMQHHHDDDYWSIEVCRSHHDVTTINEQVQRVVQTFDLFDKMDDDVSREETSHGARMSTVELIQASVALSAVVAEDFSYQVDMNSGFVLIEHIAAIIRQHQMRSRES